MLLYSRYSKINKKLKSVVRGTREGKQREGLHFAVEIILEQKEM